MPNIIFRTSPVRRMVDGKEINAPLAITIDSDQVHDLQGLKNLLLQKMKEQKINVKIDELTVGTRPLTHITEIQHREKATDFSVKVTQLTAQELEVLKAIRLLNERLSTNQDKMAEKIKARDKLNAEIDALSQSSQGITEQKLAKVSELHRFGFAALTKPLTGEISVTAARKSTLFAHKFTSHDVSLGISNTQNALNKEHDTNLIPSAISAITVRS